MGTSFVRDGYEFASIDTSFLPVINDFGSGTIGLQFGGGGLAVALPASAGSVDLEAGAWAEPIDVEGLDSSGAVVASVTIPQQNALGQYQLVAPSITDVRFIGGQNEGLLTQICAPAEVQP
jgi:hypothetical protein